MAIPNLRSRVNLSKKAVQKRRLYPKKSLYRLFGGPVSMAWLSTPGTLVFRIGDIKGMYDSKNNWVPM